MQPQLDVQTGRMLVADWFRRLACEADLPLNQYGANGEGFILSAENGFNVTAKSRDQPPYLTFIASDSSKQQLVDSLVQQALARVVSGDFGEVVWHSTSMVVRGFQFESPFSMGPFLQQLRSQVRVVGWRRLGQNILMEFAEELLGDRGENNALFAPKAVVHVHIAVPAPCHGYFSSRISHVVLEVVAAICTFALGRGVQLPPSILPGRPERTAEFAEKRMDSGVLTLAKNHVSLDIFGTIETPGGFDHFTRMRAVFLTFDAALREQHDAVACILYVVAAEALCTPNTAWRHTKPTKRFIEFFRDLIPDELDKMVGHGNFEAVFGIRRGRRSNSPLRRELLERIYDFRSGHVHAGLRPSYRGLTSGFELSDDIRRGLFAYFAEAAVLHYLCSPRSSLVGHPGLEATQNEQGA